MSNKLIKCCFCDLAYDADDYGATNTDNGKFLCYECVEQVYMATIDAIKEQKMNASVKEEGV